MANPLILSMGIIKEKGHESGLFMKMVEAAGVEPASKIFLIEVIHKFNQFTITN